MIREFPQVSLAHLSDVEVAWLAGMFEGEGCFSIVRGKYPQWRTMLSGNRAVAVMESIRPWMGTRRSRKIDEILALRRAA